jgi:2-amino-4-hydroxy-6-hydroxymethyldihydropteridine diphosphokinase
LHERAFVLAPLAEIAPEAMVPGRGRVQDLLARVDCKGVSRIDAA